MKRAPTEAQFRVLSAIDACTRPDDPADGWGEIWTHFAEMEGTPPQFAMRNFDRSANACERAGWISVTRDEAGVWINLTDAGRTVLRSAALDEHGR